MLVFQEDPRLTKLPRCWAGLPKQLNAQIIRIRLPVIVRPCADSPDPAAKDKVPAEKVFKAVLVRVARLPNGNRRHHAGVPQLPNDGTFVEGLWYL